MLSVDPQQSEDMMQKTARRAQPAPPTPANDSVTMTPDTARNILARNIHKHLVVKGWPQAELVRRSGVDRDSISKYANAKAFPEKENLRKMAEAFGIAPGDLAPEPTERGREPEPDFQMTQLPGRPGISYLRVNIEIHTTLAARIVSMLAEAGAPSQVPTP